MVGVDPLHPSPPGHMAQRQKTYAAVMKHDHGKSEIFQFQSLHLYHVISIHRDFPFPCLITGWYVHKSIRMLSEVSHLILRWFVLKLHRTSETLQYLDFIFFFESQPKKHCRIASASI